MLKMICKGKGFTLVETLIALALLGMIMLFVTRTIAMLSDASEDTDDMIRNTTDNIAITLQLQDIFMQGSAVRIDSNRVMVVTPDGEITISVENNALLIDNRVIAPLLRGTLTKNGDGVLVDLVLTNKSFIHTIFYINEGGAYEKTPL